MYATDGAALRARWQVLWQAKGKTQRKEFGTDFAGARDLYVKLIQGERKAVTLRCANVAFPPPDKYADQEDYIIVASNGRRYRGKRVVEPRVYRELMGGLNARGIWYCPYCMAMRRFVKRNYFMFEGIRVDEPSMQCPMCRATHRDNAVSRYNPISLRYREMRRTRSDKGTTRD